MFNNSSSTMNNLGGEGGLLPGGHNPFLSNHIVYEEAGDDT